MSLRPVGTTGSIIGVVTSRKPVGGAYVAAVRTFPISGRGSGPTVRETVSDAAGRFRIDNLSPASYKICVRASGQPLLDPCLWSGTPPTWNLSAGQTGVVRIQLEAGAWINMRVNDPGQKSAAAEQPGGPSAYRFGIVSRSGRTVDFQELSRDSTGRTFRIAAPTRRMVRLIFNSGSGLMVVNHNGSAVAAPTNGPLPPGGVSQSALPASTPVAVLAPDGTGAALAVGAGDQNLEFEIQ